MPVHGILVAHTERVACCQHDTYATLQPAPYEGHSEQAQNGFPRAEPGTKQLYCIPYGPGCKG